MENVHEVENPIYLTQEEIRATYWDKQVLLTNIQMMPDYSRMHGGIVRYYAIDSIDELYRILGELNKTEYDDIGICGIEYIGNIYLNLYAGGSVS